MSAVTANWRKMPAVEKEKNDTCVFRGRRQPLGDFPSKRGEPAGGQPRGTKTPAKSKSRPLHLCGPSNKQHMAVLNFEIGETSEPSKPTDPCDIL